MSPRGIVERITGSGTSAGAASALPESLADDPAYAAAAARLLELQLRRDALDRERSQRQSYIAGQARPKDPLTLRAETLVSDDVVPRSAEQERAQREFGSLLDELAVVARAIEIQTQRVDEERARVARLVSEAKRGEHRRIVGDLARHLRALAGACAEERRFREDLRDRNLLDVSVLRPMPLTIRRDHGVAEGLGAIDDPNSIAGLWWKDAVEHELIDG